MIDMNSTAHKALTQVISGLVADNLDENTTQSLRSMLELDSFQPVRELITRKIAEIDSHLKKVSESKSATMQADQQEEKLLERILESINSLDDVVDDNQTMNTKVL